VCEALQADILGTLQNALRHLQSDYVKRGYKDSAAGRPLGGLHTDAPPVREEPVQPVGPRKADVAPVFRHNSNRRVFLGLSPFKTQLNIDGTLDLHYRQNRILQTLYDIAGLVSFITLFVVVV
jgi:hypothetical protein